MLVGAVSTDGLVRGTSACFIAVYVLALLSAIRILDGRVRTAAIVSFVLSVVIAAFSALYLLVPVVAGALAYVLHRTLRSRDARDESAAAVG